MNRRWTRASVGLMVALMTTMACPSAGSTARIGSDERALEESEGPDVSSDRRPWRERWFAMTEADRELKEDIERELAWSPFVDADDIRVSVRDGVATLRGTVDDADERRAAIENAYEAGADHVKSRLSIRWDVNDFFYPYSGYPQY